MISCKKFFVSIVVFFVLLSSSVTVLVNAQVSWVVWSQTYGGTDYDFCYSMIETSDGWYALGGYTSVIDHDGDFLLIKTDGSGNVEWNQTLWNSRCWGCWVFGPDFWWRIHFGRQSTNLGPGWTENFGSKDQYIGRTRVSFMDSNTNYTHSISSPFAVLQKEGSREGSGVNIHPPFRMVRPNRWLYSRSLKPTAS